VCRAIADELADGDYSDWTNGEFLNHCGEYMQDWLSCLDALGSRPVRRQTVTTDD
jgi:hypothetical protein